MAYGPTAYDDLQSRLRRRAICLIALFAILSVQKTSASKQLAPQSRRRDRKPI